jgi:uncharacterized protein
VILHYLDTSALVKLYLREAGSRRVRSLASRVQMDPTAERLYVSRVVFPEAMSAFTRRRNTGKITASEASIVRRRLFNDFTSPDQPYDLVEATDSIVNRAALLVVQHGLRGFDAVHLSTALYLRQRLLPPHRLVFVTSDNALTRAAQVEKLDTRDPTKK